MKGSLTILFVKLNASSILLRFKRQSTLQRLTSLFPEPTSLDMASHWTSAALYWPLATMVVNDDIFCFALISAWRSFDAVVEDGSCSSPLVSAAINNNTRRLSVLIWQYHIRVAYRWLHLNALDSSMPWPFENMLLHKFYQVAAQNHNLEWPLWIATTLNRLQLYSCRIMWGCYSR